MMCHVIVKQAATSVQQRQKPRCRRAVSTSSVLKALLPATLEYSSGSLTHAASTTC